MPALPDRKIKLKAADYAYFIAACGAGVWQAWCLNYSGDDILSIFLVLSFSVSFAVASYGYLSAFRGTEARDTQPPWKPILVLWAGMPLSVVLASLSMLATLELSRAVGFGADNNVPLVYLVIAMGEGVACLAWAKCLQIFCRQVGSGELPGRFRTVFVSLFLSVLLAEGLIRLAPSYPSPEMYFGSISVLATATSAIILVISAKPGSLAEEPSTGS